MWPFMIVKMGLGGEIQKIPVADRRRRPVPKLPKRYNAFQNVVCRPPSQPLS